MSQFFRITLCALICALAPSGWAQTTQPAVPLEQQALAPGGASVAPARIRAGGDGSDLLSTSQLFSALFIVLSLIFAAKWLVPKIWPAVASQRHSAIRILGRTPVSPKNQILLVQVGQRILVLGENAGALSTLSTIDDSNEVALLVGKANTRVDRESERATPFASTLAESSRVYAGEPSIEPIDASPEQKTSGELADLISKVRGLARHVGRS